MEIGRMKVILGAGALALALASAALAQNSFPTPGGATVPGYVTMCINAGIAVPCAPTFGGHVNGGGAPPVVATCAGFALGSGGTDSGGKVTLTSGTTCSLTFGTAFTNPPACVVTPGTAQATAIATTTTAALSVTFSVAQTAFSYVCIGT